MSGRTIGDFLQARDVHEVHFHGFSPPPVAVPLQLPAATSGFVNRDVESAAFHSILGRMEDVPRPRVVVVSGMRGVGKSAAATRWAHEIRDRFDGGQLYVDLGRIAHRGGVAVSDVLQQFVEALGGDGGERSAGHVEEPETEVADRVMARIRKLQTKFLHLTAGRRLLILVDDAMFPAQVTPLLPASADSVVVVTSPSRLEGLLSDGAKLLTLSPLQPGHGAELILRMVGTDRSGREAEALVEVVELCGGLPIALRAVGAHLVARPDRSIATVAARLRDERRRLDQLVVDGDRVIEAAFEVAYAELPDDARALYRVLGMHPGPEFGIDVLAVAAQTPVDVVEETLDVLVLANLLETTGAEGRYRFHELVRLHALRRAESDDTEEHREAVVRRAVEAYLRGAVFADHAVMGSRLRLADHPWLTGNASPFPTPLSGMEWFETERLNLLGAVRAASRRRWDTMVWTLCEALWAFYYNRKHFADWVETHELAVESTRRLGHASAEARLRSQLGRAFVELERYEEAHAQFDLALRAARAAADRRLQASVVEFVGRARFEEADYPAAIAAFEWSRTANAEIGQPRGFALQTHHLGRALGRSGRLLEAVEILREALDAFDALPDERNRGRVLISLGEVYRDLGRYADAEQALVEASDIMQRREIPFQVALALEIRADVARLTGDHTLSRRRLEAALEVYTEAGSPRAGHLWRQLHGDAPQPGSEPS